MTFLTRGDNIKNAHEDKWDCCAGARGEINCSGVMVIVIVRNVDMRIVFRACFGGFSLLHSFLLFLIPLIYLAVQNLYLLAFIYLACAKSCFIIIVVLKHFLYSWFHFQILFWCLNTVCMFIKWSEPFFSKFRTAWPARALPARSSLF